MIKSLKHLSYVIKYREHDLDALINNIENYYYRKDEQKFKDGKPKIKKWYISNTCYIPKHWKA